MGNETLMEALAEALGPIMARQQAARYGVGYKHDTDAAPISVGYNHGPGGLLTWPGVDPAVFATAIGSKGILGQLPSMPTLETNPTYFTVTGVTADTGVEKSAVCDDAPVAGLMKGCLTTSVFGRYERQTAELELNRLGQRVDRADPLDLRLVNSPIAQTGLFSAGNANPNNPADVLVSEVSRKFWERNLSFHRLLSRQLWSGNPANNAAAGGYKELTGIQLLVNTGYKDAETGAACASMDSVVRSFGYGKLDDSGSQIVAAITSIFHYLKDRAERAGVDPVRWVMAMRPTMFYELSSIWPCSYLSYRCAVAPGMASPMMGTIDAQDAVRFRDEMRAGKYLLIDGERIEVVLDDAIPELNGNDSGGNFPAGCFSSDIYFLPMSVVGGRSVLYLEYFQYANPSLQDALGNMVLGRIEGAFLTWPKQTNQCVQWQSKIEPRLVLRTPWLAARLQNIVYCPIAHEQEPFPTDPYYLDGGHTSRVGPSFYQLWG